MRDNQVAEFNNVRFCYGEVCAVEHAGFTIPLYGLTAVVGPNGGGKTTLMKLLSGILTPSHGEIKRHPERKIGYVSQHIDVDRSFPITVKQAVLSGTLDTKIHPFFRYKWAHEQAAQKAIDDVGLNGFESRGVNQLSGGQVERMMIARALASNADVILLDEPDSSLDIDATKNLYEMLNILKKNKTLIVVSHRIDQILEIADQALYVNRGVKVFHEPEALKPVYEGGMVL